MELEQIFKNIDNIIVNHIMINDKAMKITQSLGYNGFKRLHRYNEKCLLHLHQKLENCYFDKYRKILDANIDTPIYNPIDLKAHLEKWKLLLELNIQELGELNQEHFDLIGVTNSIVEELICKFNHDYEKVCRWITRFNESNWNSIDCHLVDDCLHNKIKKKEEGE